MSRLDQPGPFGGPRVVKPQANVYTVLLLLACLCMAAALAIEIIRLRAIANPPTTPKVGSASPALVVPLAGRADRTLAS